MSLWGSHPSMYSTIIMSSSGCNLCTMESCYAGGWCLCRERERVRCHTCRHAARALALRPWHGQACRRRCGQKLLSCWYSIPFSNRVVAVKLYSICLVFYKRALRHLFQYVLKSDSMLYLDVYYSNVYKHISKFGL